MSEREKNLLSALVVLAVIIIALFGVTKYQEEMSELRQKRDQVASKKVIYESSTGLEKTLSQECKWILENEPEEMDYAVAMGVLERLMDTTSEACGLEVKSPKINAIENEGGIYRRIEGETTLKGTEEQVVKWMMTMHDPTGFRGVTSMRMIKSAGDEMVECEVVVEQKVVEKVEIE